MKTLLITVAFGILILSFYDVRDEKRGCIASAYQAEARGVGSLEENLAVCDSL